MKKCIICEIEKEEGWIGRNKFICDDCFDELDYVK